MRAGAVTTEARTQRSTESRAQADARTNPVMNSAVECLHCGVEMTAHLGSGGVVKYFRCSSCHRWVSSAYREVFRADTKVRRIPERPGSDVAFDGVKMRLERWLGALDDQDPYHLLGVSPLESPDRIRQRYHELALLCHPDRGGSVEKMSELNDAYERILNHRARRAKAALPAPATDTSGVLPDRNR